MMLQSRGELAARTVRLEFDLDHLKIAEFRVFTGPQPHHSARQTPERRKDEKLSHAVFTCRTIESLLRNRSAARLDLEPPESLIEESLGHLARGEWLLALHEEVVDKLKVAVFDLEAGPVDRGQECCGGSHRLGAGFLGEAPPLYYRQFARPRRHALPGRIRQHGLETTMGAVRRPSCADRRAHPRGPVPQIPLDVASSTALRGRRASRI